MDLIPFIDVTGWARDHAPLVPVITAAAAVLGAMGVAGIGVYSNFRGHELTRRREEATRIKRERREAAADALAAWRDVGTARSARDEVRKGFVAAGENQSAAITRWSEIAGLIEEAEDAGDTVRRERLDRDLARERPDWASFDSRARDLSESLASADEALFAAQRQLIHATAVLDLTFGPAVSEAYKALIGADVSEEDLRRARFVAAARAEIETPRSPEANPGGRA